ncbi:MAG TPA: hypothetical protein VNH18_06370 [Bryobacteraceae bacterium]|nr:hypothetical protein [Bryobacteraceae bacterium]
MFLPILVFERPQRRAWVQIEKRHAGIDYHQQHSRSVNQARGIMNGATRALLVAVVLAAAYWFWAYTR